MRKNWMLQIGGSEFKVMRLNEVPSVNDTCDNPEAIEQYLRPKLAESVVYRPDVENFIIVHLNTRKRPTGFEVICIGTLDSVHIAPREVFRAAIVMNAAAIVLVHNHPSGDPSPSQNDIHVTRKMVRAGQLLKIDVVDHVILGAVNHHSSLRELGYLYD